jgi:4-hydroxyphenylpyruvate dioxygenase
MAPHIDINLSSPSSPTLDLVNFEVAVPPQETTDFRGYDHVHWYVGNAKQAVTYYVSRMGFKLVAYRALDTGSRVTASYAVRNGGVTFVLTSPLKSPSQIDDPQSKALLKEISYHLDTHGDAVKDVAFEVDNVDDVYYHAIENGGAGITPPHTEEDEFGTVRSATIKTYGDTTHTLIERKNYSGPFLPGYKAPKEKTDRLNTYLPPVGLEAVDHCVGNQDWEDMESVCR